MCATIKEIHDFRLFLPNQYIGDESRDKSIIFSGEGMDWPKSTYKYYIDKKLMTERSFVQ